MFDDEPHENQLVRVVGPGVVDETAVRVDLTDDVGGPLGEGRHRRNQVREAVAGYMREWFELAPSSTALPL